jgi:hypothetical protein
MLVTCGFMTTATPSSASTLTVCAAGCAFSDFQLALDAAEPGDTILLRAGETFVGNFVLPVKPGAGPPILVRSDASDTGLPGAGTRLVPDGYPGSNTDRTLLARLRGVGGTWRTTAVLQAAPGAHHYRLQFLEFDGIAMDGWETIVDLGNNSREQATLDAVPYAIVLDRIFVHGHPTKGQKRCVSVNGRDLEVRNSYIVGCSSFAFDAQAIAGFNGPGPVRIINNYLEASGENVMFGGADPEIAGLVPSDIEIRRNHFSKPLAWRDPILPTPSSPSVVATVGGGSLGAGTHYFTVVAVLEAASEIALSAASSPRAVSVGGGAAVTLTWNTVPGADRYRIYRGTSLLGQDRYLETSAATTSLTYSGSGEREGVPPVTGRRWSVKNLLELKNAQRVLIDGNIFEHIWPASQQGYAILLTPRNDDGTAPWSVVRDVTFTNNIIRHASGGIIILGDDYIHPSQRTERITIRNNLVYDLSGAWGGSSNFLLMTRSPVDVKVDHNTIFHEGMIVIVDDGASPGFELTNNLARHNEYGIFGSGAGVGNGALAAYFPGAVVRRNALAGGRAASYPPDNLFPDVATFDSQFSNLAADDFRLRASSIFRGAATDGSDLGVDFAKLAAALGGAGDTPGGSDGPAGGSPPSFAYGGSAVALPGRIEAENFDEGGAGAAYLDTTGGNSGGKYRNTDVDIESTSDAGGGHNIGWIVPGERLNYTVNVSEGGTYLVEVRAASSSRGGTFHIEVNGTNVTGPLTIPDTGGWQSWRSISRGGLSLSAGTQVWTIVIDRLGPDGVFGNINYIAVSGPSGSGSADAVAYGGSAVPLPGRIEAENFDKGGAGAAYLDTTGGNSGGKYRETDVDIEPTSDAGGGHNIGWIVPGERLNYTVNVREAGTYLVEVRVASSGRGGTFHIEVNGTDATGQLTIPDTGGWQSWTSIARGGVPLGAGRQVWTVVIDTLGPDGVFGNINYIAVSGPSGGSADAVPYLGRAASVPGRIEAENFDAGSAGRAYFDTTGGNSGGKYRNTDVDIELTSDAGGGHNIGWLAPGEWLSYTVEVSRAGSYTLEVRAASPGPGGTFHIEVNGTDVTGPLTIPNTRGSQSWATVEKAGVTLHAGPQIWKLVIDNRGLGGAVGNINSISVFDR